MNKKLKKKQAPEEETNEEEKDEDTEETDTEEADEEEKDNEKEIEKIAKQVSQKIAVNLGLDSLKQRLNKVEGQSSNLARKIFTDSDIKIDREDMTKEEVIVNFFKALVQEDIIALKALSEGVAADGGYLFPDEFKAELIRDLAEPTRMRGLVRVVPMKKDIMNVPKLGSRPTLRWTSENASKSTTTMDFSQKTLTVYKVAAILYASEELIEDCTEFDVVKLIIDLFAEAIAEEEDKVITAGTGTGQPTGLTNCSISSVTCSGNLDFDDIIDLIYALPAKYRTRAQFLVHNVNIKEMRKLKDSQNRYLWQESVAPGQPATFHGYPVIENNWLPESEIYFGDYKAGYFSQMLLSVKKLKENAVNCWEALTGKLRVISSQATPAMV